MTLQALIDQIDNLIDDESIAVEARIQVLWQKSMHFWEKAFSSELKQEEMLDRWAQIIADHNLSQRKNGKMILEILSWPATGQPPVLGT